MNNLEIINVSNGSKDYIGNFTKQENEIILSNLLIGNTIHFFSGNSEIGNKRIDLYSEKATDNIDVFDYIDFQIKSIENDLTINKYTNLIIDSPYNKKFALKYDKLFNIDKSLKSKQFIIFASTKKTTILMNYISNILKPNRIILKSWNYYIPKGYFLNKGFLCYAGGYRKSTILLILDKIK